MIPRYEIKYPIQRVRAQLLLHHLKPYLVSDPHGAAGTYRVYSIYFDTRDLLAYREKRDGVADRIKFRLRTYPGSGPEAWYLESKARVRHYVQKHRVRLSSDQALVFMREGLTPGSLRSCMPMDHPLARDIVCRLPFGLLRPIIGVLYRRQAFSFRGARNSRITWDDAIESRRPDLRIAGRALRLGRDVLEIKGDGVLPEPLRRALWKAELVAESFSKYGQSLALRGLRSGAGEFECGS